ncbi:type II toxin-antitoxin system VapC family toxin [Picosynechococcus sp. PCC 11901]|uniref:type II toxin-antitoxin system VapC family toxin n=1 Tax=Picosynechococcus sp. PCC 11901 TaxID=2579791 RepID=UPI0010FC22F7|nr:PIN domain-containing protein [Picosynechococcus sp. PCC 11901]QCS50302.1 type II toxin-antitoxin system VapC family toxin [Picosynechococcus sp. PCC 11901]
MKKVFADTGYWIALLNPNDDLADKAKQLASSLTSTTIVTSEMIFSELLNAFSKKGSIYRERAIRLIDYASQSSEIEVIPQTTELFSSALDLYKQRPDQGWSHTDCSSFCIMQQQDILEALAYDKHFEQAGFIALLRR